VTRQRWLFHTPDPRLAHLVGETATLIRARLFGIAPSMRVADLVGYPAIVLAFLSHHLIAGTPWEPEITFTLAAIGVIPLAHLMGESTEELAARVGPTWGGLLNATFGNAAELIIGVIALMKGLNDVVKASLTGSILGNLLLVAGGAMLVGGWNRDQQKFNPNAAEANAGLLTIAVAAMLCPAIFHFTAEHMHDRQLGEHELGVSLGTSIILLAIYALGLLFSLRTHKHLFCTGPRRSGQRGRGWGVQRSVMTLLVASLGVALVAELLVGSAAAVAEGLGWSPVFVGVILLAIIGNAAEHSTALRLAHADDMDTALTITYQSSLQIALFVTPVLVFVSVLMEAFGGSGSGHLDLVFTPLEVVSVMLTVSTVVVLLGDGRTNWFEGTLLLGLYLILGVAFFFMPAPAVP
jgi:Ca2+:H+ antiporter